MKLSVGSTLLITAFAPVALAVNSFTAPIVGDILYAGSPFTIKWNNTDGGSTVDLLLRNGSANDLETVLTIAKGIPNNGAAQWSVPANLETGAYALEIIGDGDPNKTNYTPEINLINRSPAVSGSATADAANSTVAAAASTSVANSTSASVAESSSGKNSSAAATKSSDSASKSSSKTASASSSDDSSAAATFSTSTKAASATGANSGAEGLKIGSAVMAGLGAAALFL